MIRGGSTPEKLFGYLSPLSEMEDDEESLDPNEKVRRDFDRRYNVYPESNPCPERMTVSEKRVADNDHKKQFQQAEDRYDVDKNFYNQALSSLKIRSYRTRLNKKIVPKLKDVLGRMDQYKQRADKNPSYSRLKKDAVIIDLWCQTHKRMLEKEPFAGQAELEAIKNELVAIKERSEKIKIAIVKNKQDKLKKQLVQATEKIKNLTLTNDAINSLGVSEEKLSDESARNYFRLGNTSQHVLAPIADATPLAGNAIFGELQ